MSNTPKLDINDVVADIDRILQESGLSPDELTVSKYASLGGTYDGRNLRRLGGFAAIVDANFREDKQNNIFVARALSKSRIYTSRLERQVADTYNIQEKLVESFEAALERVKPVQISNLHKPDLASKSRAERENGVLISDIHLGLKIDREEIGCNAYSWQIASRRLGKLSQQVALYKLDHRDECDQLRVLLGGDLAQGVIHLDDDGTDLMSYQFTGLYTYIVSMIDFWRHHYKSIVVECTPDNHMRFPHKGPGRQHSQKADSFATMLHVALQGAFRTCDDVTFHVPKSAITTFDMLGHKMALSHGDTHIKSGNVGSQIDVKSVVNQVLRLNANVQDGRQYKAIFLGHVHVPMYLHMPECDATLVVNGTGSGTDGFAHGLGYYRSSASQVIWETTREYPVGDWRRVDMGDADDDASYDGIIKEYTYGYEINRYLHHVPPMNK